MAQLQHENVIQQLGELGLNPYEAEVYMVVLRLGEASASIILGEVELHREQVYRALKRMVDTGILTYYIKRKRGYYSAIDPSVFVNKAKAKVEVAESVQPYLKEIHQQKPHIIRVIEGIEALKQLFDDIVLTVGKDSEYLVMGGSGQIFYELSKDFFPRYTKIFNKNNIRVRLTTYGGEDFTQTLQSGQQIEIRQLPRSYKVPAATVIYGNKVAIQILDPDNVSIIVIENKDMAEAYRQTFETMWDLGKPLK